VVTLPDNHLQYALTWYGLAGVLVISFVTRAFGSGEEPGGAEDAPPRQGISPSL
jgi:cytochrome oxidase assembly protein ShyY1